MMSVQELQVKKKSKTLPILDHCWPVFGFCRRKTAEELELTFECYHITVIFHIGILKIPKAKKLTQKLLSAYYKLDLYGNKESL